MKEGSLKPGFLKKSAGPTNFERLGTFGWNNMSRATSRAITCQACLRNWPKCKEGKSRTISVFLGLEIVEHCCGALLDQVYDESRQEFAIRLLNETKEKPLDFPNNLILRILCSLFPGFRELLSPEIRDGI